MLSLIVSVFIAPLLALIALLWSEGIKPSFQKREKYPPWLESFWYPGQEAGWIETILGLISRKSPLFCYNGYKKLPKDTPWIACGKFPNKSISGKGYAVADVHIAREILTSPHSKKSVMYEGVDVLTSGFQTIFTANGHRWKHARKGVAPAFSSNHIKRMNRICEEHLARWIEKDVDGWEKNGEAFDISLEMIFLTMGIIAEAAFEYKMTREEMYEYTSNLEIAADTFIIANPLHKLFPWLFPAVWKARRSKRILQKIAYTFMESYRKNHKKTAAEGGHMEDTIIHRVMNNPNYTCDDDRAADIVIFLAAGHDTAAYSIAWTLVEIFRNHPPELQAYREKIAKLPQEEWRHVDELHRMIKEAMRLQPVLAMGTVRDVGKEISYMHGDEKITLPKDSIYFINFLPMFRNPKYYDDPEEYRPSRWVKPKCEEAHFPYSVGPRNCIGQVLANSEMHTVVSQLIAKYDFEVVKQPDPEFMTAWKPAGCKLVPKKRVVC